MSLGLFLAAGRSFIGMKDTLSPYRMRRANLLPKFGSEKNPFETPPEPAPAKAAPAQFSSEAPKGCEPGLVTPSLFEGRAPLPAAVVVAPEPAATAIVSTGQGGAKARRTPGVDATGAVAPAAPIVCGTLAEKKVAAVARPPAPGFFQRKAPSGREWFARVNPLPRWWRRIVSAGRRNSRGSGKSEQAEFSLEQVKVMRNDLNDSDLVVQPVRRARPAADGPAAAAPWPAAGEAGSPTAWSRLTKRCFGAGEPQIH